MLAFNVSFTYPSNLSIEKHLYLICPTFYRFHRNRYKVYTKKKKMRVHTRLVFSNSEKSRDPDLTTIESQRHIRSSAVGGQRTDSISGLDEGFSNVVSATLGTEREERQK